jgi:pantoate--beta-alanine ligase
VHVVDNATELRARLQAWRQDGARIGLVPTMGNLHAGHFSLLAVARERVDRVVASIFVNPTQFGPREDFASYPRTPGQDLDGLRAHGCDLVFTPDVKDIYPFGADLTVRVDVPVVSESLEGAFRPGHFTGVATVVTKLFNFVQPDLAVFGQKDYQQLLVIRRMARDLAIPVEIAAAPTCREPNGLAMSSRNQYLTTEERARAGIIHRTLKRMATAIRKELDAGDVERDARSMLEAEGLIVDYAVVRRAEDLQPPLPGQRDGLIALVAARMGRARLIDNLLIEV